MVTHPQQKQELYKQQLSSSQSKGKGVQAILDISKMDVTQRAKDEMEQLQLVTQGPNQDKELSDFFMGLWAFVECNYINYSKALKRSILYLRIVVDT